MTSTLDRAAVTEAPDLEAVLQPVRRARLADAKTEADRIIAAATASAETMIADATAEADADVERARSRLERSARAHDEQLRSRIRDHERRSVLATQEQIRQTLIEAVHRAAGDLRSDPRYPMLLDRLEELARLQLGDRAVIDRDPEPDGGVVARTELRTVDYRLPTLADRALDALADEVASLWD